MSVQREFRSPGSLVEEAVRVITDRIVRGEFTPGMRLVEERLAGEFGISRPPIRESFRVLERHGLLTISPRRGVRVRQFTPDEVRDIYLCRAVLRGLAARLATQNMTPAALKELQRATEAMAAAAQRGEVVSYQQAVSHFNGLIAELSGNHLLKELLHSLTLRAQILSFTALSFPERMASSLALHRSTVEAFQRGDSESAERFAKQSLEESIKYVIEHLNDQSQQGDDPST
jgi:DNA-binding GntR family transcriptional regulator